MLAETSLGALSSCFKKKLFDKYMCFDNEGVCVDTWSELVPFFSFS